MNDNAGVDYQITVTEHPKYLHVRVTGRHSLENARRFVEEAHQEYKRRGFDAVLLEQALTGPSIGPGNIFSAVEERLPQALLVRRIAWVDVLGRDEGRKFLEDAARNRGINLCTFTSVAEAVAWLEE